MNDLLSGALAGFGGAAIVLSTLFAWLGKVQADRISESEKARNAEQLELLRAALQADTHKQQRISNARWKLYMDVWSRLQDIQTIGERLWIRASANELANFLNALGEARVAVNRGRLTLRHEHYRRLCDLLSEFENYEIGKKRLIEFRKMSELAEYFEGCGDEFVSRQIQQNRGVRQAYQVLLDDIASDFKAELGLDAQPIIPPDAAR